MVINNIGYYYGVIIDYGVIRTLTIKKAYFVCFNESPLKMVKNVFYFKLKALFVLKIFKFLC